jgi:hypothetical protein
VLHQVIQQAEFGGAEVDLVAGAADAVGDAVDDDVAVVDAVVGQTRADAAQDGADAGDQLDSSRRAWSDSRRRRCPDRGCDRFPRRARSA